MKIMKQTCAAFTLLAAAAGAQAEITWSKTAFTFLAGNDYLNPFSTQEESGDVITIYNAASYNWGKSFVFFDRFRSGDDEVIDNSGYGEANIDFSLTGGKGFEKGPFKDVYLATTLEHATATNVDNVLVGASVRWRLPGFAWVDTGIYYRENGTSRFGTEEDNNYHFASAWGIPFSIAGARVSLEGFIDLQTSTETNTGNDVPMKIVWQPKLSLDVGHLFIDKAGTFNAGIEYDYRKNVYGVKGQDMHNPQLFVEFSL